MKDPIKPGPKKTHQWVPLFLAHLAISPDLDRACQLAETTLDKVRRQQHQSGYFNAALSIIMREHRRRGNIAGPAPPAAPATVERETVSAADFTQFAGSSHGHNAMMHADVGTLLHLCSILAEAVGVENINGVPIYEWFNKERRVQLERDVLAIGDRDPDLAEHLQRHLPRTSFPDHELPA